MDIVEQLSTVPRFEALPRQSLAAMVDISSSRFFRRGTEILCEGKRCNSLFIVLSGRAKMVRSLAANGRNVVLSLFGPGDLFGVVGAVGTEPCNASVVALEDGFCLEIVWDDLAALFESRPELIRELLPALTRHLAECGNCIVEATCFRVEKRLARLLLKLADTIGRKTANGILVPVQLSRQEMADMTGTRIETCIRIMSRWSKGGILASNHQGLLIRKRDELETAAGIEEPEPLTA